MNINLEQIDELRKRSNASYEEAKKALEESNGNMVEALIYLERNKKAKHSECNDEDAFDSFVKFVKRVVVKGNNTKLIIKKNDSTVLSLPVTLVVIVTVIAPYISLGGLILALVTGYKIRFQGKDGQDMNVNKHFEKAAEYVSKAKNNFSEETPVDKKTL